MAPEYMLLLMMVWTHTADCDLSASVVYSGSTLVTLGSDATLTCSVTDTSFLSLAHKTYWKKRQSPEVAVSVASSAGNSVNFDTRYISAILQDTATHVNFVLTIKGFTAADVGAYYCEASDSKTPLTVAVSREVTLTASPVVTVQLSTTAPLVGGVYTYGDKADTTCTAKLDGSDSATVKVSYNDHDHTGDFTVTRSPITLQGSKTGLKTMHQEVYATSSLLSSTRFMPQTPVSHQLVCAVLDSLGNELARSSIDVALAVVPTVTCIQSGPNPMYQDAIDVYVQCKIEHYNWKDVSTVRWQFEGPDVSGNIVPFTLTGEETNYYRAPIFSQTEPTLHIIRVTSDMIKYPGYKVLLLEDDVTVASTSIVMRAETTRKSTSSASSITQSATLATMVAAVFVAAL